MTYMTYRGTLLNVTLAHKPAYPHTILRIGRSKAQPIYFPMETHAVDP